MWQSWDRYNRIFLFSKDTEVFNRFLSDRSYLGKADYQLVFKDGVYYSYEIKDEFWRDVLSHLHNTLGAPHKLQREIHMGKSSSHTIHQILALILLVGTITYLVLK